MDDLILQIKKFKVNFPSAAFPVLELDEFSLSKGEIVTIIGDNAAGKSTLLAAISKFYGSGELIIEYEQYTADTDFSYVMQRPSSQLLTFRGIDELDTSLSYASIRREERLSFLKKYVNENNLGGLINKNPRNLSSGEQQSLVIHASTIKSSKILLLDEPFSMLDQDNLNQFKKILQDLKNNGIGIIIVDTHPKSPYQISDRIYNLKDGKLIPLEIEASDKGEIIDFNNQGPPQYWIEGSFGFSKLLFSLNLRLPHSGLIIVRGKNGSGKTALLKTLAGIINLQSGAMNVPKNFLYLPQDTFSFFWKATIDEELEGICKESWLDDDLSKSPFLLSEGERKRLALHIVLESNRPLLLDEPTQGLDSPSLDWFMEKLRLRSEKQLILIASNNLDFLVQLSLDPEYVIELGE